MNNANFGRFLARISNYFLSHQFASYIQQPKADIRRNLDHLFDAYQANDIDSCLAIINQFNTFPGYPYYRNGNYWQHMFYVSRYFHKMKNKTLPKMPVIATPKSASSYICVILSKLFDIPPSLLAIDHVKGCTPWVNAFGKWGGVTHEHYHPSADNIALLQSAGIQRCVIHTRDPLETLISKAFHWIDRHEKDVDRTKDRTLLAREYLDSRIESMLKEHADWLKQWRDAAANGQIEILETHYEEMKADPLSFFKRILAFSGVAYDEAKLITVLEQNSPSKKKKKYNFRKALKDEWKEVLTAEQVARAKLIMENGN